MAEVVIDAGGDPLPADDGAAAIAAAAAIEEAAREGREEGAAAANDMSDIRHSLSTLQDAFYRLAGDVVTMAQFNELRTEIAQTREVAAVAAAGAEAALDAVEETELEPEVVEEPTEEVTDTTPKRKRHYA